MFSPRLFMIHDTRWCCEDDEAKLAGGKKLDDPFLEVAYTDIEAWGDNTGFINSLLTSILNINSETYEASYRPLSWITILPDRWSSTSSNSPM